MISTAAGIDNLNGDLDEGNTSSRNLETTFASIAQTARACE